MTPSLESKITDIHEKYGMMVDFDAHDKALVEIMKLIEQARLEGYNEGKAYHDKQHISFEKWKALSVLSTKEGGEGK